MWVRVLKVDKVGEPGGPNGITQERSMFVHTFVWGGCSVMMRTEACGRAAAAQVLECAVSGPSLLVQGYAWLRCGYVVLLST